MTVSKEKTGSFPEGPNDVQSPLENSENFESRKHTGRQLIWVYSLPYFSRHSVRLGYSEALENKTLNWEVIKFIIFFKCEVTFKRKKKNLLLLSSCKRPQNRAEEPAAAGGYRACFVDPWQVPKPKRKVTLEESSLPGHCQVA